LIILSIGVQKKMKEIRKKKRRMSWICKRSEMKRARSNKGKMIQVLVEPFIGSQRR